MSTVRPHSNRDLKRSSRVSMSLGGRSDEDDDLLLIVMQGIKGVEKLLLCTFLAHDELDIVDEKHIDGTVFFTEFRCGYIVFITDRVDQFICKFL